MNYHHGNVSGVANRARHDGTAGERRYASTGNELGRWPQQVNRFRQWPVPMSSWLPSRGLGGTANGPFWKAWAFAVPSFVAAGL